MSSISIITSSIISITRSYLLYSGIVIVPIGVIGNALNILVFNNLKIFRGNPCSFYFNVESIINIGALIFVAISYTLVAVDNDMATSSIVWCKMKSILMQIFAPISITIVCFAAIDQFFSTSPIVYIRQCSTIKLARHLVFVAVCFWVVHSIPFGIFSNPYPPYGCFLWHSIYNHYQLYFYYPILVSTLPMSISSIASLLAFRNVRRIIRRQMPAVRRRLDRQMTALVFARVITFIILFLPYTIYFIYWTSVGLNMRNPVQYMNIQLIGIIIISLSFLNSAVNHLFYSLLLLINLYSDIILYFSGHIIALSSSGKTGYREKMLAPNCPMVSI
jgi:hypothetical protein